VRFSDSAVAAGILLEDQVWPKSCGHVQPTSKEVVPRAEALARIRAACDARDAGADILIVARTDARQARCPALTTNIHVSRLFLLTAAPLQIAARVALLTLSSARHAIERGRARSRFESLVQAEGLEEALERAQAFARLGADVLFIDALESLQEMRAFTALGGVASGVPKMASMLEGGRTPIVEARLSLRLLLTFNVFRAACQAWRACWRQRPDVTRRGAILPLLLKLTCSDSPVSVLEASTAATS
jgi:2-methylisocitrate lyase-like PEP mutase family enzyme